MARSYAVCATFTGTASASLPDATLISATSVRPKLFAFDLSSDTTPGDQSTTFAWQRCTTTGTPGSNPTPFALDPADPASQTTCGLSVFSPGPTLTANAFLWRANIYLRAAYHWQCAPGKELVSPATASNGIALMSLVVSTGSAYTISMTLHFEE